MPHDALAGARILVAGDDGAMRRAVEALRDAGAVVVETGEAELALVDLDTTSSVATTAPVLGLVTEADPTRLERAFPEGRGDFVEKAAAPGILLLRAANLVARHKAERELASALDLLRHYVPEPMRARRAGYRAVEEIDAAILFSDLRGFTSRSLSCAPADLFGALSEVLARQADAVVRHGGYIDKFSGDGLLAVFEGAAPSLAACRAACDIRSWAEGYDGAAFWRPPPIGIGIHHGRLLRGDIGGEHQREYTVIGVTVNLAARMCGAAGPLEVLVSDAVVADAPGRLQCEAPREVGLRGMAEPMALHPLLGIVD